MTDNKPQVFSQGVTLQTNMQERSPLIMIMLWGSSGYGKTTLACTLPGKKLLISFDPGGQDAVSNRIGIDVDVLDFSSTAKEIVNDFKSSDNPFNLRSIIDNYDSVVLDSLTTISERATDYGISVTKGATIERPSPGAYGARNALVLALVQTMMRLCNKHGKHLAVVAHEKSPQLNDEGVVELIEVNLGGQLPQSTALRFSEVWACYNLGVNATKMIGIRDGVRQRRPCKSRMFDVRNQMEFAWKYDPDSNTGHTIAEFHEKWKQNGYQKIAAPK